MNEDFDEDGCNCSKFRMENTTRTCQTGHVHYPAGGEIYTPSDYDTPIWTRHE